MKIKRPAILVAEPHTINMGATNKAAMNCAPTRQSGLKPTRADTPSPKPNIANNSLQWQLHVGAQFIAPDSQFTAPDSQFIAPDSQFIAPDSGEK